MEKGSPTDARVLILTGPPGVGKTTAARALAERHARAVHLEIDAFFGFIRSGYVEPWRPESRRQNEVVMKIAADAAIAYAKGGYLTILEGIVLPRWFLDPLRRALEEAGLVVAYAVLRAPLDTCKERARSRDRDPLEKAEVVEDLWSSFADLGDLERHAVDVDGQTPQESVEQLARLLAGGALVL